MSMSDIAEKVPKVASVLGFIWKALLVPLAWGLFYLGQLYFDSHYVSKPYFDKAMSSLVEDKGRYAEEQKMSLKEISTKLDSLLFSSAANSQKFIDTDRRLNRLEDKVDRLPAGK